MNRILTFVVAMVLFVCLANPAMALTLRKGSTGSSVEALQNALNEAGYGPLKVDGKYGIQTVDAVKACQRDLGLKVDGVAGPDTLSALGVTAAAGNTKNEEPQEDTEPVQALRLGDAGPVVLEVQELLALYNYPVGEMDGKYGMRTYKAVRLFQKLNGLKVDGIAGQATVNALRSGRVVYYTEGDAEDEGEETQEITACVLSNLTPVVGDTITASVAPMGASAAYIWYRDGVKVSSGKSYKVTGSDIGCELHCVATGFGSAAGSATSNRTHAVVEAVGGDLTLKGTVLVKNRAEAGSTLGVTSALNTDRVHYKWYLNGTQYAETKTIVLTDEMIGSYVYVSIEAEDESGFYGSLMSNLCYVTAKTPEAPVENIDNNPLLISGTVVLAESCRHGDVLTARVQVNCKSYSLAWYVNGDYAANTRTFKVEEDVESGSVITVRVVPNTDSGYRGQTVSNECVVGE